MNAVLHTLEQRGSKRVSVASLEEAARLIGTDAGDVTTLPYANGEMAMSQRAQLDDTPVNRNASLVVQKLGGVKVGVRGTAIAFPKGLPW